MKKLEQAARALLTQWDTPAWKYLKPTGDLMADLREALAEQALSKVTSDEHCKGLGEELYKLAEQVDMNLNCKSVQKRLATSWGYVKAEQQETVAIIEKEAGFETEVYATGYADSLPDGVFKLYAAPVRTKDLTDDEIADIGSELAAKNCVSDIAFARAVIAKFKENNK